MVHDAVAGALLVGVSRHVVAVARGALRTRGFASDVPAAKTRWSRAARVVLGLALAYPPATLAQPAAAIPVVGASDPGGLTASSGGRRDPTTPTLERLIDLGRLDEAREKLREPLTHESGRPRRLFLEAMILHKEKQYLESLRRLERSLALSDRDPDVYKLAGLNLVPLGRRDLAGPCFEAAVALAPRDFMARYYLGLNELSDRRYASAEAILGEVITLRPDYLDAHLLLGVAEEGAGKEDQALGTYRRAIELAEQQGLKSDAPFLYLARLLIRLQRHEESVAPLKRAMALDVASSEARTLLGQALTHLRQYGEALRVLSDAVALAPQDKTAHFLLMTVYNRLGRRDDAAREMQLFRAIEERD